MSACVPDALTIAWKGCSKPNWEEPAAQLFASRAGGSAATTLINVGANKGYNAAAFLSLWTHRADIHPKAWYRAILEYATGQHGTAKKHNYLTYQSCGACNAIEAEHSGD